MRTFLAWLRRDEGFGGAAPAASIMASMLLVIAFAIATTRIGAATTALDSAALSAARAASISRSSGTAQGAAQSAAQSVLAQRHLRCAGTQISVNTAGFSVPAGEPAQISATVTCQIALSDLAIPGMPGTKTITATHYSPIDTFRQRS